MPFLRGRTKKVEPSIETENTLARKENHIQENGMKDKMPPYLSTLKFQLQDLEVDVEKRSDDLEEGVECTSLPTHKTIRVQTITLPMDMPVVGGHTFAFRRKVDCFSSSNHGISQPSTEEAKVSYGSDIHDTSVTESVETLSSEGQANAAGRWFSDIDKLTSFKAKLRLESFSTEKNQALKEWATSPKNFYKCILKHRQKKLPCNRFTVFTCEQPAMRELKSNASSRKVWFPPEILLFSAIEENMVSELKEIIKTHRMDVNLCQNSRGLTPLHRAVQLGSVDCVRTLINHEADVNIKDSRNVPALDVAIRSRQFECIVLLIEAGANIAEYTRERLLEYENAQVLSKSCYRSFEADV